MKHSGTDVFPPGASASPVAVDTPGAKTAARPRLQIYWYHPDHLGTGTLITDLEGRPHQFFLNLPYGETFIEQKHAGYDNPYKFNGKELDEETGLYYYGARYYDPKISLWLSVDPLAEKYPGISPYAYTYDNPVRFMDPTGMEGEENDWKPIVFENGNVGYVAEKGDNAETFASQYGLDEETAKEIVPENVQEGDIISGEKVKEVTGSEVLKLDLTSKQATDQRVFDQYLFAIDYTRKERKNWGFFTTEFYKNVFETPYHGKFNAFAKLNVEGKEIPVMYSFNYKTTLYITNPQEFAYYHSANFSTIKQTWGAAFSSTPKALSNFLFPIYINYKNDLKFQGYDRIIVGQKHEKLLEHRLKKFYK